MLPGLGGRGEEVVGVTNTNSNSSGLDKQSSTRPAFFDGASTTPLDPRVLDKMLPLLTSLYGNPHSRSHSFGWEAEEMVERAREEVASLINCSPKSIVFTSGATESNNMAIRGLASHYINTLRRSPSPPPPLQGGAEGGGSSSNSSSSSSSSTGTTTGSAAESSRENKRQQQQLKNHIITTQLEHKCVLQSCRQLQEEGWEVTFLPVDKGGLVDPTAFEAAIRPGKTLLASIMFVNNEIGVVQDLKAIGEACRRHGVYFHTDAAQGFGKLPIDVEDAKIDLMSISGHKIYGPKGVGALYIRSSRPRVRLTPLIEGGGQERGFRSGTLPAPLIVGLGEAARIAKIEMANDERWIRFLGKRLYDRVKAELPDVHLNGHPEQRYCGNLNLSFEFVEGESLLMSLKDVAISSGSACTSASLEPSYVLRALGVGEEVAHTSLRFGIGRFTTKEEVDRCVDALVRQVKRLRDMSPLAEFASEAAKEGGVSARSAAVWT